MLGSATHKAMEKGLKKTRGLGNLVGSLREGLIRLHVSANSPESMETALYFPFSTIEDPFLLKSALLLWDQLEYISPGDWLQPQTRDPDLLEAIDIVGKPIYPTE